MPSPFILKVADVLRLRECILRPSAFKADSIDVTGTPGSASYCGNLDGGHADSNYGGISPIDGGGA